MAENAESVFNIFLGFPAKKMLHDLCSEKIITSISLNKRIYMHYHVHLVIAGSVFSFICGFLTKLRYILIHNQEVSVLT